MQLCRNVKVCAELGVLASFYMFVCNYVRLLLGKTLYLCPWTFACTLVQ
jgi:hypothetical protein